MRALNLSDEHIQRTIDWHNTPSKNIESTKANSLTIRYPNVEAFLWFRENPFIWQRENWVLGYSGMGSEITMPVVVGADYQKMNTLMAMEGFGSMKRMWLVHRFKFIERGVVAEYLDNFYKQRKRFNTE